VSQIERWVASCVKAGLILLYQVGGKSYLKVLNTQWQTRSQPKFPLPTDENNCLQSVTPVHLDVYEDVVVDEVGKPLAPRDESRSASNGSCVAYIPLNTGEDFGITGGHLAEFEKAYPAVDCVQTLQEIRAWCVANPTKRKTKVGVLRFVNSWLSREQNKAH